MRKPQPTGRISLEFFAGYTFAIGSLHEGIVSRRPDKGPTIQLPYGLEGFAPNSRLAKENGKSIAAEKLHSLWLLSLIVTKSG